MKRRTLIALAGAAALGVPCLAVAADSLVVSAPSPVDRQPGNPGFAFGSVWVPSSGSGYLDRVDPHTLRVVARIRSARFPAPPPNQYYDSVAFTKSAVWHASDLGNVVARIDPRRNRVVAKVQVGGRPDEIAAGPTGVYVGLFQSFTVERISPATNRVVVKRNLDGEVLGMAASAGRVWALSTTGPAVLQLDPRSLKVRKRISVKSSLPFVGGFASVWWLAADAKTLCVGNLQQNAVTIIDPSTSKVVAQVALPFGRQPFSVAAANGSCWVTNDSGVFRVGADGAAPASAKLPANGTSTFTGVVAGDGGAWVTLAGRNAVVRVS